MYNSQEYIEVKIFFTPFSEDNAEIIEATISDLPYDSFLLGEDEPTPCLKAYIPKELYDARNLKLVLSELDMDIRFSADLVQGRNWNQAWEDGFPPIAVGRDVLIKTPAHDGEQIRQAFLSECGKPHRKARYNITIQPRMAFGTGHHSTTRMVVLSMLAHTDDIKGKNVLDMGCGTGVLGILALKMGAAKVQAIDIDAVAAQSAFENGKANRVSPRFNVRYGDASLLQAGSYDTILANIHRNVLLQDMHTYGRSLRRGGLLVMSGFFDEDVTPLLRKADELGFDTDNAAIDTTLTDESGKWSCISIRRGEGGSGII